MKNPLISVIINNYNYARYLGQAVQSVLDQTYENFELIIVDDGSTDNSRCVAKTFADERIQCVFKSNGGQASAFNAGFKLARGELVAWLDSDDWWKPDKLETIVRWNHFLNGNFALLQHGVEVWDKGRTYPYKKAMLSGDCLAYTFQNETLGHFVGTSGLTFPYKILAHVMPVPLEFRISADAYLTRTAFTMGLVYSIPDILGCYRKHQNAVFGNVGHQEMQFQEQVLFPALNAYYRNHDIPFRYSVEAFQRRPSGASSIDWMLQRFVMMERFKEICALYPRIALYGAGSHTKWLEQLLSQFLSNHVVAVIDNVVSKSHFFDGVEVEEFTAWDPSVADALVMSTDCFQEAMLEKCRDRFGLEYPVIDIYEGLPPGPHRKYVKS